MSKFFITEEVKQDLIKIVSDTQSINHGNNDWLYTEIKFNEIYDSGYSGEQLRSMYRNINRLNRTKKVSIESDKDSYDKQLDNIAKQELSIKENRNILNRQRSIVDMKVREYSDKKLASDTMMAVWGKETFHLTDVKIVKHIITPKITSYHYADVHWDYTIDLPQIKYNKEIAKLRLWEMANWIVNDVVTNGIKEFYLTDHADDIEGTSLRVGQLIKITEEMTKQAREYSNEIVTIIKWLSKQLPDVLIHFMMVSLDNHSQLRLYNTKRDEMDENLALLITNTVLNVVDTAHEYGGMENLDFTTADEILLTLGNDKPFNIVLAHGHQYSRNDNILEDTEKHHKCVTHLFIGGHWHRYSFKSKDVKDDAQQAIIFLPSVVGDTDFSEKLHVSCMAGFAKITIDTVKRNSNSEVILFDN